MSLIAARGHAAKTLEAIEAAIESGGATAQNASASAETPGAVRLDMSAFKPGHRKPPINDPHGPRSNARVPRGYVLCGVQEHGTGDYKGFVFTEHGGATLLSGRKGGARYVLGCAHVPCTVGDDGRFKARGFEHVHSIRPNSRAEQPLVLTSSEVYIHPYYEAGASTYRFDLSLSVLPEAVDLNHAISRHDMRLHAVDPGEKLMYCGMGAKEAGGDIHPLLHFGSMMATERSLNHITELTPIDDEFEQGFSGGPMYSQRASDQGAWSGVISHYAQGEGKRQSYIIPASVALPWADKLVGAIEADLPETAAA